MSPGGYGETRGARMERNEIANAIALAAGPAVRVIDAGSGWPSILEVDVAGTSARISAFLGPVHSMARKEHERRFQNPSGRSPIIVPPGTTPMLLGWSQEFGRPVVVSADAFRRIGQSKRQSYLHPVSLLQRASMTGWSSYQSSSDEEYVAFWPSLLPVELARRSEGLVLPDARVITLAEAAEAAPSTGAPSTALVERQRALASRLIRDGRFSKLVLAPYQGRCALTGIGLGAVVGAHIYPAAAPGSPDSIPNGMALTDTVHRIFDAHRLYIHPKSLKVKVHPELLGSARSSRQDAAFLKLLRPSLALPASAEHRPDPYMFERRYEYFEGAYAWAV